MFVGLWLLFEPLVFLVPLASAYNTDAFVGTLVIFFSLLLPCTPIEKPLLGPEIPLGWSYIARLGCSAPVIAMAFVGFFIAQ